MSVRHIAVAATLLLAAAPAFATLALAQAPLRDTPAEAMKFIPQEETAKALMTLLPGQTYAYEFVSDHENYFILFAKRVDHGNSPEVHEHWIDNITIVSGEGSLTYGGELVGAKPTAPGEARGGSFTGATTTQPIKPGDFFLMPAGIPHMLSAAKGKELTYLVFKTKR